MKARHRNLRKAAILIASLDDARAGAILAQMSPEQAEAVRGARDELGPLDPAEQRRVIEEFFRIGPLVPDREPSGIELNGPRRESIPVAQSDTTATLDERASADEPNARGRVMHEASVEAVVSFLEQEQPQTIAVVVSRLSSERAAAVLAALSAETQVEVARRIVDLDETDPEIVEEIEKSLRSWLDEQDRAEQRRAAGMTALAGILEAANPRTRANILENLGHGRCAAEGCAADPPRPVIRFADLMRFDSASLNAVLSRADTELLVLALAGANAEFAERALQLVSPARAHVLAGAMRRFGPTRLSDIEAAQQELADLAAQLETDGEIVRNGVRHLSVAV